MTIAAQEAVSLQESRFVLILDDDLMVTEGLAAGLEREGRTIITCNDIESAEIVLQRCKPSHVVSDVRLSGPFGFEGLEFLHYARRHSPQSRIILMTGDAPEALQLEASERGAVAFLRKPFEVQELDVILDLLDCSVLSAASNATSVIRMPLLDDILTDSALRPLFQPIVALDGRLRPVGYEALARYRKNPILRNPEVLFQYAERKHRVAELEIACLAQTLEAGSLLAAQADLFMNIHPDALNHGKKLSESLAATAERNGVNLRKVVLEITEQGSIADRQSVFDEVTRIRNLGVRFALDDVGVAYSHLPFIDKIQPSFLKISQHFGTAFETDPTKTKIIANLLSVARDFECELILEGIEHSSTLDEAMAMGIQYGQGYLFSHPVEAEALITSS